MADTLLHYFGSHQINQVLSYEQLGPQERNDVDTYMASDLLLRGIRKRDTLWRVISAERSSVLAIYPTVEQVWKQEADKVDSIAHLISMIGIASLPIGTNGIYCMAAYFYALNEQYMPMLVMESTHPTLSTCASCGAEYYGQLHMCEMSAVCRSCSKTYSVVPGLTDTTWCYDCLEVVKSDEEVSLYQFQFFICS